MATGIQDLLTHNLCLYVYLDRKCTIWVAGGRVVKALNTGPCSSPRKLFVPLEFRVDLVVFGLVDCFP